LEEPLRVTEKVIDVDVATPERKTYKKDAIPMMVVDLIVFKFKVKMG